MYQEVLGGGGGCGGEGIGTDLFFWAKIEFSPVTFTSIVKIVRKV